MHCFVPCRPSLLRAPSLHSVRQKRRRRRRSSSIGGDHSSKSSSSGLTSTSPLASSWSTFASTGTSSSSLSLCSSNNDAFRAESATTTTTTTTATTSSPVKSQPLPTQTPPRRTKVLKKTVRFADTATVYPVSDLRTWKHHHQLWWQAGELPTASAIVQSILRSTESDGETGGEVISPMGWFVWTTTTTPMDQARRIISTTEAFRRHHAVRGGGHVSIQAQRKAVNDFQSAMQPCWRGLEFLLLNGGNSTHVLRVVDIASQWYGRGNCQQPYDHTHDMTVAVAIAARKQSRAAAHLALERARFDAKQVQ